MGRADGIADLESDLEQARKGESLPFDGRPQRFTGDVLHHHEREILGIIDRMYGDDIGMIEGRGGASLPHQAHAGRLVGCCRSGQRFDRNQPSQLLVFGLVHHAHAALTDLFHDAVMQDDLSRFQRQHETASDSKAYQRACLPKDCIRDSSSA